MKPTDASIRYVVIFRAKVKRLDHASGADYSATANRMRELALAEFGCLEFKAVTEGCDEIALSYWPDEASIAAWRRHPEHIAAQRRGREEWYEAYSVEVAAVTRCYGTTTLSK